MTRPSLQSSATAPIRTEIDEAMETRRRLNDAMTVYGNGFDDNRESAIDAIASGRAAFWTVSTYGAARTVDLPLALNAGVGIVEALVQAFPDWRKADRVPALETIVPLNHRAANALALAYARFGVWKDDEELLMRGLRDCRPPARREPLTYANFVAGRV